MRGLLVAVGLLASAGLTYADSPERVPMGRPDPLASPTPEEPESAHNRAMAKEPIPVIEGAPACRVDQLALLAQVTRTSSRHGATLKITAKDPKQTKTVQNLVEMLDNCIKAADAHAPTAERAVR